MANNRTKILEPGIYRGMKYEEYAEINAFNSHLVPHTLRSLKHLDYVLKSEDEQDERKCFTVGRMVETLLFEPNEFSSQFQVIPEFYNGAKNEIKPWNLNSKTCKGILADIQRSGKTPIKSNEFTLAKTMAESVREHRTARQLVAAAERGIALVWKDETFGVLCKAFLDMLTVDSLNVDCKAIADLKTTINASKGDFRRSAGKFGYHIQGAMYVDGWRVLTGEELPFDIVAVESEPPHCVAVYRLDTEAIQTGQGAYTRALKRYLGYLEGERSGYSDFVEEMQLPGYVVADEISEEGKDDSINGI
jgi:hypothetical protein